VPISPRTDFAAQVIDLRPEDTSASRPAHSVLGDRAVREERLELLRNVGLPGTQVSAPIINDRITKEDDNVSLPSMDAFRSNGTSGLPLTPSEHRPDTDRCHGAPQATPISTLPNKHVRHDVVPPWRIDGQS
jgi:hypothetical protein